MTIRRYIFISIPVACVITIIVSLVLSQPKRSDEAEKKENIPKESSLQNKQMIDEIRSSDNVTQTVDGLLVPNYNENGTENFIMRGKNTFLLENDIYKIIEPEIEVLNSENSSDGTQTVIITSNIGEMDKESSEGYLSDNVVVHLDSETQLNTESMKYLPTEKVVFTNDFVTIARKGIVITGKGCEIDLVNKKMWIKKDAEMETDGTKNDLFFLAKDSSGQAETQEKSGEKTVIRSAGKLVFDRNDEMNIMTFHDNVEVQKSGSTVFSDKLVLFLDAETKKMKQAIARGNVLASQGDKIAKGNALSWDVNTQSAILEDDKKAEFIKEDINIDALKMIFYKNANKIDVPSAGNLKVKMDIQNGDAKETTEGAEKIINVTWDGKMNYSGDSRQANFTENVEARRDNSILRCKNLDVMFFDEDYNIKNLYATEDVHIIDKNGGLFSEALGDELVWNVRDKVSVLQGKPFAILREGDKRQIISPKVSFFDNGERILCEGNGSLYEQEREMGNRQGSSAAKSLKVVWSEKMTYDDNIKKASFYEEVQVIRRGQRLNGDQIDAYLNDKKEISKIITTGNVYFYSENLGGSEGFGTLFTWDLADNLGVLTGDPKAELRKEGSRTFSKKIYFDMKENQISWEGRPHWQIITKESNTTNASK